MRLTLYLPDNRFQVFDIECGSVDVSPIAITFYSEKNKTGDIIKIIGTGIYPYKLEL